MREGGPAGGKLVIVVEGEESVDGGLLGVPDILPDEELEVEAARCEVMLAINIRSNRQSQVQLEISQVREDP